MWSPRSKCMRYSYGGKEALVPVEEWAPVAFQGQLPRFLARRQPGDQPRHLNDEKHGGEQYQARCLEILRWLHAEGDITRLEVSEEF